MRTEPFDLEKARAGAPVCTRDGRDVRIICWDRNHYGTDRFPIVALVADIDAGSIVEITECYDKQGYTMTKGGNYDLFMKAKEPKHCCGDACGDNRFEIIEKAKESLLEGTNIESCQEEMAVLDSFLFRCWQMGWLGMYDRERVEPNKPTWDDYTETYEDACEALGEEPWFTDLIGVDDRGASLSLSQTTSSPL